MNFIKLLAYSVVGGVVISVDSSKAVFAQQNNGRFIRNSLSGQCIDVAGAPGTSNGAKLQVWNCESSGFNNENGSPTDQKWTLTSDGFIKNTFSNKCIDVAGAPGTSNGAPLLLWDCESSGRNNDNGSPTDQQWQLISGGFIRNSLSGKCIDVAGAPGQGNGSILQLWDCELSGRNSDNGSSTDQTWSFVNASISSVAFPITGERDDAVANGRMRTSFTLNSSGQLTAVTNTRTKVKLAGFTGGSSIILLNVNRQPIWASSVHRYGVDGCLIGICNRNENWSESVPPNILSQVRGYAILQQHNPKWLSLVGQRGEQFLRWLNSDEGKATVSTVVTIAAML